MTSAASVESLKQKRYECINTCMLFKKFEQCSGRHMREGPTGVWQDCQVAEEVRHASDDGAEDVGRGQAPLLEGMGATPHPGTALI